MDISIINDIKNTSSPNAINERGRKLCPITHDIVTCNNSIKIENVIYTTKGLCKWVKRELEQDYERLYEICGCNKEINIRKSLFVDCIRIRSPMTNLYYDKTTTEMIYNIFIHTYDNTNINSVYKFINEP